MRQSTLLLTGRRKNEGDKGETGGRSCCLLSIPTLHMGFMYCFSTPFFVTYMVLESAQYTGMPVHGCTGKVEICMDANGDRSRD